jgi:enoyl-[acyl-carrier protein] reductase I
MAFLAGKRILITGLLSNRSIAYGIAQACHRQGAQLAFTYVGDRFHDRIVEFATEFGSDIVLPCDVSRRRSTDCACAGTDSTVSCTRSALRHARRLPVSSSMA